MTAWRFERPPELPAPLPDAEAQPFFEALKQGRLAIQRCVSCNTLAHPPRAMCHACRGADFEIRAA